MSSIFSNRKFLLSLVPVAIGLIISWLIWVTNASFSRTLVDKDIQSVTKSVEELKGDFKSFKKDVDEKFTTMQNRVDHKQDRMMEILLRMERRKGNEEHNPNN